MTMKLIRKKAPNGTVRHLTSNQEDAIKNFYGLKKIQSSQERELAKSILREMRKDELWLQCCCVTDDNPALSSANLRKGTLYLSSFGNSHDLKCPMYRIFKGDDDTTQAGTQKKSGSKKIDYTNFLPIDESGATLTNQVKKVSLSKDRTRRKSRPRIARLLLTLISDARINALNPINPLPKKKSMEWIDILRKSAEKKYFVQNRPLSDIVLFNPLMNKKQQDSLMQNLESSDSIWPEGKARIFYQIFMSSSVTRESVKFSWGPGKEKTFNPVRGVSINGESQDGIRPPYWVILSFIRSTDNSIICSEGYAHALYKFTCPIPVDSKLERDTLKRIEEVAIKLNEIKSHLSLVKPLFDIEVEVDGVKGFVLPDFIVQATMVSGRKHIVVVETMGYLSDEYCERKTKQHKGMNMLGTLVKDPPNWPIKLKEDFLEHLYGIITRL
ncbi:hypothetical protein FJP62_20120 [Pantoea vagans]|nr:hypothetical protein FJP62_20120 [Pantoea vagans]